MHEDCDDDNEHHTYIFILYVVSSSSFLSSFLSSFQKVQSRWSDICSRCFETSLPRSMYCRHFLTNSTVNVTVVLIQISIFVGFSWSYTWTWLWATIWFWIRKVVVVYMITMLLLWQLLWYTFFSMVDVVDLMTVTWLKKR